MSTASRIGRSRRGVATLFTVWVVLLAGVAMLMTACSPKRAAVNLIGDALAEGGDVYASEPDPELVIEAVPFGLKTMESLLETSPDHRGLLLATAKGFTGYAFLLQDRADRIDERDLRGARTLRARARGLYLRGRDYALRGLAVAHPDIVAALDEDPEAALAETTEDDVPFLYWAGAAWAGAISLGKDDLDLVVALPAAGALVGRVLALDPAYGDGAADEFFIAYESGRPGGDVEAARAHYDRALALSRGERASVHLALAENVEVPAQDLAAFRTLLEAALAIDPDAVPSLRLVNTLARRRAEWLKAHIPDLFLLADVPEASS